jgi:hypothetical protein
LLLLKTRKSIPKIAPSTKGRADENVRRAAGGVEEVPFGEEALRLARDGVGRIDDLRAGDAVSFTDMDGETVQFEVVALDVLHPADIEEMTAGDYDLTLFTCTYGGKSRITVRCMRA